jgi:hypothetical protein
MNAATITTTTVRLTQGATPVAATVAYDATSSSVVLKPTASLAASTTYTVRITGGSSGVKDAVGNPLAADTVWTFTTAAGSSYLSDLTLTVVSNGWGPLERDRSNGDAAAGDGGPLTLNGTTYPKGLGVHAPSDVRYGLNGACTAFSAMVGLDDEVGASGSVMFQVWTDGVKRYDSGVVTGTTPARAVYVSVTGATQLALVVTDGGDDASFDHSDWANAQVACSADSTPPTVTVVSPPDGASGTTATLNVAATFSEAMNASSLTTTTVRLTQGTTPVTAAVSYDGASNTVLLNPAAALAASTTYTVRITGGSSGAKDVAGNPLAADKVWTFTTAASSSYLSDLTLTVIGNGWGPVERDRSNGDAAAGDGVPLTLNGVTYAKGLGVHAPSEVRYGLNGACTAFSAMVGVDDEVGAAGSVVFQVWIDGVKRYDSGVVTGVSAARSVYVSVTGATQMSLIVTDGGDDASYDHSDWADAQVACR